MKKAKVTVDAAIICDDARREANNKIFLIGVWSLELAVRSYPSEFPFVFHCEGAVLESGAIEPRMWIRDDAGGVLYDSDISDKSDPGQFVKGRYGIDFNVILQLTRDCVLDFIVKMADEEIVACKRRVVLMDTMRKERDVELGLLEQSTKNG